MHYHQTKKWGGKIMSKVLCLFRIKETIPFTPLKLEADYGRM